GLPKGIVHTHASSLSYATLAADVYGLRADDRLSGFPPLHFDQSIFDYMSGPSVGATTVIISEGHMMMPASLSQLMADERLTVWYSVPYALVQLLLRGALDQRDLSSLRWVLFGGEVFPPKHLRALMLQWPQARFSNVYGPAEVNQCTFHHMDTPPADDAVLPIGPIWPNAEGLVLGPDEAVLPPGEAGELVVRTPTMMQGYWNRPALNDRAFYHRPRAGGRTDLFYRTGDLVRQDEAGTYWFLGRQDRQIKARGYRIELDEVEAALLAHAAVAEAAVYAVPGPNGGHQVQAALLLHPGPAPTPREILAHAAQNLPAFALPARLDIIDQFPRTSTGKIDRRALRARAVTTT
ncbi:MAG: AMP-binding protein, partial [Bacteroidota bacterium]